MPRPPLPIGTAGKIRVYPLGPKKFRAVANYKDYDGVTRPVERVGKSATQAETRLKEALRDRAKVSAHGEIKPDTRMSIVAEMWLSDVDASNKARRTKQEYRRTWDRYLVNAMGAMRVQDAARVSTVNRVIMEVRDRNGRGAALHVKVVLSGIFAMIVRHDAIELNPVRELDGLGKRTRKKKAHLVSKITVGRVLGLFHSSEVAKKWDLVDMVDVLSGVGCRIGELLALDYATCVDFTAGTITFKATVIRIIGQGLIVQEHTKSEAGDRTIRPPVWVMEILKRRSAEAASPWVFPSRVGTLADPDNVRKRIRETVAGGDFEGLHPHDFRHYVATVLDQDGLSAREIADYLGHERITTTQDEYMERGVVGQAAGAALSIKPEIEE